MLPFHSVSRNGYLTLVIVSQATFPRLVAFALCDSQVVLAMVYLGEPRNCVVLTDLGLLADV